MEQVVYSLCFMCSIRCPIKVFVEDGRVKWIQGNENVGAMGTSLCPRGSAGISLLYDKQRLQYPLIRTGPRGSGQWRKASWKGALDLAAEKLEKIIADHGGHSVALTERAQLSTHVSKTFLKAIGSPNHFTHDALCKGSANTACRSLFGVTDGSMGVDVANTRHIVLYGRNLFESIEVKPVRGLINALAKGAKLTYIDPRVTVSATKAHRYWMIRPGTDLALNYALIHVIIKEKLYDAAFVDRWVEGFSDLRKFVQPYTPEWADNETGIPATGIVALAREMSAVKPNCAFHYGYRAAHHTNEIYVRRSIHMLNALLGCLEAPGAVFFKKGPGAVGRKAARKLTEQDFPKIEVRRVDKVGTPEFPLPDPAHGVPQMLPRAILDQDPYPVKALLVYRFEPLMSIPDKQLTQKALDALDLIVTIDINHSDIAWYSDIVLPESIYLERLDCVQQLNSLSPQMFLRHQAVTPRYDTLEGPMILKALGERIGIGKYFPYRSMEELVRWQLEGTGFSLEDFAETGFVSYTKDKLFWDRLEGMQFKTPSGKIEFRSSLLEEAGFESFPVYESMSSPPGEDQFRLITGRQALHTHVSTQNNMYLNEITPENELWLNCERAEKLGIRNHDLVRVSSSRGSGTIRAYVSELIHPEAAFMLHGFGRDSKLAARTYRRGVSDSLLQENITDMVGGSPALHHTFVTVSPA